VRILFKLFRLLILYPLLVIGGLVIVAIVIVNWAKTPSNDRHWNQDQAILPYAEIQNNLVTIHNVRNFTYASTTSYTAHYYDKTFDVEKIKNVYYIVEPFSGFKGSAHTFLSFEFEGDNFVAISVEIRKEKGETFSAVKGLFANYEIMYVIADENDVVKLRSNHRKDLVYVYPVKATKEKMQALFLDMIARTNELKAQPEFYNSITNNCTTNIASHVNTISPNKVGWNLDLLLPANSDKYAYELGLIDNSLPFEEIRTKYLINERASTYADAPDFSVKIRQ
jgi:hypothetical protein